MEVYYIMQIVFCCPLFFLAVVGNCLILYVKLRKVRSLCKIKNGDFLIVHIAVCDINKTWVFILAYFSPLVGRQWVLGSFACVSLNKVLHVLFSVTSISVLLLTYERYRSIIQPYSAPLSKTVIRRVAAFTWLVSGALILPPLLVNFSVKVMNDIPRCLSHNKGRTLWFVADISYLFIVVFIPSFIILYLTTKASSVLDVQSKENVLNSTAFQNKLRRNKSAIYILRSMAIAYLTSYIPFVGMFIYSSIRPYEFMNFIESFSGVVIFFLVVGSFCNAPLTYFAFSKEFRKTLVNLVKGNGSIRAEDLDTTKDVTTNTPSLRQVTIENSVAKP